MFVKRNGLKSITLHGQAGSVDEAKIALEMRALREEVNIYKLQNVFNVDKTGLMYRLMPRRSYVEATERLTVRGTKVMQAKERITVILCCNATGSRKIPLSVIGAPKYPRLFRIRRPVHYQSQINAWADTKRFRNWFYDVFCASFAV